MKNTVTFHDFEDAFRRLRPENFSREGLVELWEYLSEVENDIGEEIELDVIAICCDFCEYESREEFEEAYPDAADREEAFVWELPGGGILARNI
jgi:hypothetical protein